MQFGAKEFVFKDPKAIDLGDGGAPDFEAFAPTKKKKQDAAALKLEAEKKKQAELDALPTKGKPSDFFIMDYEPNDTNDPTGGQRLPTQEQKIFIFTHYPTCAQLPAMIGKLYELYFAAKKREEEEAEKARYGKPGKGGRVVA